VPCCHVKVVAVLGELCRHPFAAGADACLVVSAFSRSETFLLRFISAILVCARAQYNTGKMNSTRVPHAFPTAERLRLTAAEAALWQALAARLNSWPFSTSHAPHVVPVSFAPAGAGEDFNVNRIPRLTRWAKFFRPSGPGAVAQALAACGSYRCLQNIVTVRNGSAAVPVPIFKAGRMPALQRRVTV